jgi:hypothetical protein
VVLILLFVGLSTYIFLWDFNSDEVIVAVLDTGVDAGHSWLKGNTMSGIDLVEFDFNPMDEHGHGTHVAGIIVSKAPETKILPVRILNKDATGGYFSSIGIIYAVFKGADVINMSFSEKENFFTELAIKFGSFKGVMFVGSTGNEHVQQINFPAKLSDVIAVGALNHDNNRLYKYSNIGKELDYVAPGVDILSADIGNSYSRRSGTSMAAPYISGAIAYIKTHSKKMSKEDIITLLDISSRKFTNNYLLKYLDYNKLKAHSSKQMYLYVEDIDTVLDENELTISGESLNANFIVLYDSERIIKVWEELNAKKSIYLEDGYHNLVIEAYGEKKLKTTKTVIVDTKPPMIEYELIQRLTNVFVSIEVKDDTLETVEINGESAYATYIRGYLTHIFVKKINELDFPIQITATDHFGRTTTKEILN